MLSLVAYSFISIYYCNKDNALEECQNYPNFALEYK